MPGLIKHGLGPLLCPNARVLILGSLPGDESIRQQRYYAHPQNQFWRIIAAAYDVPHFDSYDAQLAFLKTKNIAVWDVLAAAERTGSLDTAIRNGKPNDLLSVLCDYPSITKIGCNGQKAHALLQLHFGTAIGKLLHPVSMACLPSTSPAATRAFALKAAEWRAFLCDGTRKSALRG